MRTFTVRRTPRREARPASARPWKPRLGSDAAVRSILYPPFGALGQSEVGVGVAEGDGFEIEAGTIQQRVQRSTSWEGATVHETRNKAEDTIKGGSPVTWHMLNGTKLETEADADGAIKAPTVATSGTGSSWKAKVTAVLAQKGAADETVLAPGPWSVVVPKVDVGAKLGLAACTGAGSSTFSALGKPSDDEVYKANRRHEDHHVADHKVAFEDTVGKWDTKVEEAKTKGTAFAGTDAGKAEAALWTAMGGMPKDTARSYRSLGFTKGAAYHATAAGGPMSRSNAKSNATCTTSSVEIRNPA